MSPRGTFHRGDACVSQKMWKNVNSEVSHQPSTVIRFYITHTHTLIHTHSEPSRSTEEKAVSLHHSTHLWTPNCRHDGGAPAQHKHSFKSRAEATVTMSRLLLSCLSKNKTIFDTYIYTSLIVCYEINSGYFTNQSSNLKHMRRGK